MSEEKQFDNDPERTLITLEQLSQTIEVMTSVVNRLRQHLSEQLHAQMEAEQPAVEANAPVDESAAAETAEPAAAKQPEAERKESFVVEIRQQDSEAKTKNGKVLH